jgi:hypothetical protein
MTTTRAPKTPIGASATAETSFGRVGSVSLGVLTRSRAMQTRSVGRSGQRGDEDVAA